MLLAYGEAGAAHRDLDRGAGAEAHHPADDVAGFEGELDLRQFGGKDRAQAFLEGGDLQWRLGLQLNWQASLPQGRRSRGGSG